MTTPSTSKLTSGQPITPVWKSPHYRSASAGISGRGDFAMLYRPLLRAFNAILNWDRLDAGSATAGPVTPNTAGQR